MRLPRLDSGVCSGTWVVISSASSSDVSSAVPNLAPFFSAALAAAIRLTQAKVLGQRLAAAQAGTQAQAEPNYQTLDKPTVQRQRAVGDGLEGAGLQEELLDIPAFLRRQAD